MFSLRFLPSWYEFSRGFLLSVMLFALTACTPPGEKITGRVIFEGQPVPGAAVSAYVTEGDFGGGQPFMMAETGEDGRFVLMTGKGTFYIVARKTGYVRGRERVLKGRPESEPVSPERGKEVVIVLKTVGEGGFVPDPGTFVTGKVTSPHGSIRGTFVYAYSPDRDFSSGPAFITKTPVKEEGRFRLALREGSYRIVAMKKESGSEVGPLTGGGLRGEYGDNPVVIRRGEVRDIGALLLSRPDPVKLGDLSKRGGVGDPTYVIAGKVLLEKGTPAGGVYVMAYGDVRMVGRPESISETSDEAGHFTLYLPGPGKYYLGARESIGGPLSPGELTGAYEGTPDHSIDIKGKGRIEDMRIIVREKW